MGVKEGYEPQCMRCMSLPSNNSLRCRSPPPPLPPAQEEPRPYIIRARTRCCWGRGWKGWGWAGLSAARAGERIGSYESRLKRTVRASEACAQRGPPGLGFGLRRLHFAAATRRATARPVGACRQSSPRIIPFITKSRRNQVEATRSEATWSQNMLKICQRH